MQLHIEIENAVGALLAAEARAQGETIEHFASAVLAEQVRFSQARQQMVVEMQALHKDAQAKYGIMADSTDIIRQERDERG